MQMIVRAFPVKPGQEAALRKFAEEVKTVRAVDAADFYQRMGVAGESWHVQETPQGTWVIAVTVLGEKSVEALAPEYAASQHGFDRWFKDQVTTMTGIDPATQPLGPPTECIYDFQRS